MRIDICLALKGLGNYRCLSLLYLPQQLKPSVLCYCSNVLHKSMLYLLGIEDRDEAKLLLMVEERGELFEHFVVSAIDQLFVLVEVLYCEVVLTYTF